VPALFLIFCAPCAALLTSSLCTVVLQAAPAAIATMAATFPNAMQEDNFIRAVAAELFNLGFRP